MVFPLGFSAGIGAKSALAPLIYLFVYRYNITLQQRAIQPCFAADAALAAVSETLNSPGEGVQREIFGGALYNQAAGSDSRTGSHGGTMATFTVAGKALDVFAWRAGGRRGWRLQWQG